MTLSHKYSSFVVEVILHLIFVRAVRAKTFINLCTCHEDPIMLQIFLVPCFYLPSCNTSAPKNIFSRWLIWLINDAVIGRRTIIFYFFLNVTYGKKNVLQISKNFKLNVKIERKMKIFLNNCMDILCI